MRQCASSTIITKISRPGFTLIEQLGAVFFFTQLVTHAPEGRFPGSHFWYSLFFPMEMWLQE